VLSLAVMSVHPCDARARKASALAAAAVLVLCLPSCGQRNPAASPQAGQMDLDKAADRFVEFMETERASFAGDVTGFVGGTWLGEIVRKGELRSAADVLRDKADRAHFDIACVLSPDGTRRLLTASNPSARPESPFRDVAGYSDDGPCADMRAIIARVVAIGKPVTSYELLPPRALADDLALPFRARELGWVVGDLQGTGSHPLAAVAQVPLLSPARSERAVERRALMVCDVRPVLGESGRDRVAILVTAWLLSRSSALADAFRQESGVDCGIHLQRTLVATSVALPSGGTLLGYALDREVYRALLGPTRSWAGITDLGYGLCEANMRQIVDATGNPIGVLCVQRPAPPGALPTPAGDRVLTESGAG